MHLIIFLKSLQIFPHHRSLLSRLICRDTQADHLEDETPKHTTMSAVHLLYGTPDPVQQNCYML